MGNTHTFIKAIIIRLILLIGLSSLLFLPGMTVTAAPLAQENLPTYGWVVTEDLGVGEVPGISPVQRFRMRHQDTWELLAYCVNPSIDPPPEGSTCQLIDEDTFWCGDDVQNLRVYQILQTPPPPTETYTPTPTHTATNTVTPTPTSTQTPTPTPSTTPKPFQPATPTQENEATPTQSQENVPTPTQRSRSGQSEIVQKGDIVRWSFGGAFIGFAAVLAILEWRHYLHNKRK